MFIIPIAKSFLFTIYRILLFGMAWNKFIANNVFYLLQEMIISKYNFFNLLQPNAKIVYFIMVPSRQFIV